jgi:acyl-CoA synthetase (AMP-forming)/AMP-acid ligase II
MDSSTYRAVKTNVITGVWKKETGNDNVFEGVILIEYSLIDVEIQYSNKYFEFMEMPFIVMISIGTILASLLLYHASGQNNFWMSLLFLSILNIYITTFINTREGVTTIDVENTKVKDINDGILSISFLAAVNIYILQTLKEIKDHRNLHNESAFLFTLALVLLLFSLYKKSNYNKIDDIRTHRIEKQLMYNMSIFVNLFILFNYLVYVARDGRILNAISAYLKNTL